MVLQVIFSARASGTVVNVPLICRFVLDPATYSGAVSACSALSESIIAVENLGLVATLYTAANRTAIRLDAINAEACYEDANDNKVDELLLSGSSA